MATIYGTNFNDTQYGGASNDTIYGGPWWSPSFLTGNDTQYGNGGNDYLYGGDGNDRQYGGTGNDYLYGGTGNDYLNGGTGVDHLYGGTGQDYLVGGYDTSTDYFHFSQGDSPSTGLQADTIADWNAAHDRIDMPIAGTAANYVEHSTTLNTISAVAAHANTNHTADTYVFLYNSATDTGYLVADLDNNNVFETGVILAGAGSAGDLNWTHII